MIDVTELHKSYDTKTVLQGASFSVDPGTVAALIGPNGSGKTTTLHVLAGLVAPDAGAATISGIDVVHDRRIAQTKLAFLPQDVRFHTALTPRQVLRFYADLRGVHPDRSEEALGRVALTKAADQPCGVLSGGMRQRLGLAVLGLADADVLLLDEPGLSLDPTWRRHLAGWLRVRADAGTAVLMATHLLEVWQSDIDRVLTCADGRIRDGTVPVDASRRSANDNSAT